MSIKGQKQSVEWVRKRVESRRWYHQTPETLKKMSAAKKGEKNPFYGHNWNENQREQIVASHLGKNLSDDTKKKISTSKIRYYKNNPYVIENFKGAKNPMDPKRSGQHASYIKSRIAHDLEVNKDLKDQGFVVIRFWEHEINSNVADCIDKITSNI